MIARLLLVIGSLVVTTQIGFAQQREIGVVHRHRFTAHTAISPDGAIIASAGSLDGSIKLFDTTGRVRWILGGRDGNLREMSFSPDGRRIALSTGHDFHLTIVPIDDPGAALRIDGPGLRMIRSLAWSPDGSTIVTGGEETVTFWSAVTGEQIPFGGPLRNGLRGTIQYSSDGREVYAGGSLGIEVLDMERGEVRSLSSVPVRRLSLSLDGLAVLVHDQNGVTIRRTGTLDTLATIGSRFQPNDIRFDPSDSLVVAISTHRGLHVFRRSTGELFRTIVEDQDRDSSVSDFDLARAQPLVVAGNHRGGVRLTNYLAPAPWSTVVSDHPFEHVRLSRMHGVALGTDALSMYDTTGTRRPDYPSIGLTGPYEVSPDGARVAMATDEGTPNVHVHDLLTGSVTATLTHPDNADLGYSIAWSQDGQLIAVSGDSIGTAFVFAGDGTHVASMPGARAENPRVGFALDDQRLVVVDDWTITVYRREGWTLDRTIPAGRRLGRPRGLLATSPSTDLVVVGTGSDSLLVFSVTTGNLVGTIENGAGVAAICIADRYLYSAGTDGAMRAWDLEHLTLVAEWRPYELPLVDIATDGRTLVAVAVDGSFIRALGTAPIGSATSGETWTPRTIASPLPATGVVRVAFAEVVDATSLRLVDMLGRSCNVARRWIDDRTVELDVRTLAPGHYCVVTDRSDASAVIVVAR